jgi:RNA polymerase sigma factor (sigma-70 family)
MEDQRSDAALLSLAPSDPGAFGEFYRRHVDRMVAFAVSRVQSPEEVADLVASTFLVALERASTYDPGRGEPMNWLFGIASRLLANQRRRRARESLANARFAAHCLLDESDIERLESQIQAASTASLVQRAIHDLPERQREILLLVGTDELASSTDGARVLGITPIAFRVRLARARRALRAVMERHSRERHPSCLRAPGGTEQNQLRLKESSHD